MNERGFITATMHELERIKIIEAVCEHRLTMVLAAERLGLCERQISRLARRYASSGPAGLDLGQARSAEQPRVAGRPAARSMALVRERYADFGPTLACEKLRECHGVALAKETVRRWMREAGLWIPRKQRPPKLHQPRNRRSCLGELIQIDGSDHRWFEERAPACTLLVFIDDATSRLMTCTSLRPSRPSATSRRPASTLSSTASRSALYSDKAAVFHCNGHAEAAGKGVTQFGRALYELNIDTWCANSSQAKGRVERANLTLQDRLVKELRLRGIDTRKRPMPMRPTSSPTSMAALARCRRVTFDAHRPLR